MNGNAPEFHCVPLKSRLFLFAKDLYHDGHSNDKNYIMV